MTRVMPDARKPDGSIELLPRAILSIGITGHRDLQADPHTSAIAATLNTLFANLSRALRDAAQHELPFFSNAEPVLRTVCVAAEGADLLGAQAAQAAGSAIVCVLPFPLDEYQRDFSSPAAATALRSLFERANAHLILPGERTEGARSYERANEVILANIDLLVAIWDGKRASGRAGTGDVVQSAISRRIPVIVIAPDEPSQSTLLTAPDEEELASPIALDLARKPLNLARLVSQILSPPQGRRARQGLIDLLEERNNYRSIRFEYPLLLKLFGVGGMTKASTMASRPDMDDRSTLAANISCSYLPPQRELLRDFGRIDSLANHYGRLYLSSTASVSADNCRRFFFRAGVHLVSLHSRHFGSHAGTGKWTGSARLHDQDDAALAGAMARLSSDRGALEVPAILVSTGAWLDAKLRPISTSARILGRVVYPPVRTGAWRAARHDSGERHCTLCKATCRQGNSGPTEISSGELPSDLAVGSAVVRGRKECARFDHRRSGFVRYFGLLLRRNDPRPMDADRHTRFFCVAGYGGGFQWNKSGRRPWSAR